MEPNPDQRVARLMAGQYGVVSRKQALACGLSRHQVAGRVERGLWVRVGKGIYRAAAVGASYEAVMVIARLACACSAVFSHYTAARFHGLDIRPDSTLVWVTVPRGGRYPDLPGTRLRESHVQEAQVVERGEWRFTSVARTLVDLGECIPAWRLERVVYAAVQSKKVTLEELRMAWRPVARRPRKNAIVQVLERFDGSFDSGLEADAGRIFERHGIRLERQYRVHDRGLIVRRFDFADPVLRIGIEIDGLAHHSSLAAQQRDRAKDRALAVLGWVTIRFTAADIRNRSQHMADTVRRLQWQRQEGLPTQVDAEAG